MISRRILFLDNTLHVFFFQLDSLEKMSKLLEACSGLGVDTNPAILNGLGIVPLFSWYHEVSD